MANNMSLQSAYASMTQCSRLHLIGSYHHLDRHNIDQLVQMEMKRLKANYANEEEHYVEQMLIDHPIVVERRTNPRSSAPVAEEHHKEQQQQRAESCRKSRINNKIRKAKSKFRHKYITKKLEQSVHVLDSMRDVIAQAEAQLVSNGYSPASLQRLRGIYGLQQSEQACQGMPAIGGCKASKQT